MKIIVEKKRNLLCAGVAMLMLISSCGLSQVTSSKSKDSASSLNSSLRGKSSDASKSAPACDNELIAQELGALAINQNGLAIIAYGEECNEMQADGDLRCNQLAGYAGLNMELQFFLEVDPVAGKISCGCTCVEPVISETSECINELKTDLAGVDGWENAQYFEDYLLLTQADNCDEVASGPRCDFAEGITDLNLIFTSVEVNGENWCACECIDCDSGSNKPELKDYDEYGQGTVQNPFEIYTEKQLQDMSVHASALDQNYKLCRDLDMNILYSNQYPYFTVGSASHPFTGAFDGNEHVIESYTYDVLGPYYSNPSQIPVLDLDNSSIVLRSSTEHIGLFGKIDQASLKDVELSSLKVSTQDSEFIGGLVGLSDRSNLFNITASGTVMDTQGKGVGGLLGVSYEGTLSNITSHVEVTGRGEVGGVIGRSGTHPTTNFRDGSYIHHVSSSGDVSGKYTIGGVLGYAGGRMLVDHSHASSNVLADSTGGGLVGTLGYGDVEVSNSWASGTVAVQQYEAGGLVGEAYGGASIENCFAQGKVGSETVNSSGGLLGRGSGFIIRRSYATGNVVGDVGVGGLIGANYIGSGGGIVEDAYARGVVQGTTKVGGLVGSIENGMQIDRSYASGKVVGINKVGGLVGLVGSMAWAEIHDSYVKSEGVFGQSDVRPVIGHIESSVTVLSNLHYWIVSSCVGSPCSANAGISSQPFFVPSLAPMNVWSFGGNPWDIDANGLAFLP